MYVINITIIIISSSSSIVLLRTGSDGVQAAPLHVQPAP